MPYKDIKLTLLGGRKCIVNPGSILGMLEFPDETIITLTRGMKYFPGKIMVEEKIDDIKKLIKLISEEEYWKNKIYRGLKADFVVYDEIK